jgi:hypothetical protein
MTPKEKHAKAVTDLQNMVNIQTSPGNWNVNPYMHGMANGLILALHTARGDEGEVAFLPAPAKWTDEKYNVAPDAPAVDQDATNDYDEEFLIGLWLADQREAGAKTVDLEKVETIREGMRYALELRSPS